LQWTSWSERVSSAARSTEDEKLTALFMSDTECSDGWGVLDSNITACCDGVQDAQEAKKGKKKKRKGKKGDEMMLQEKSSPAGSALTDTQVSSPEESSQSTGLRPDELSEEALPEVEAPSKPDMQISQKKLSTEEQAGKMVSDAQTVATKAQGQVTVLHSRR